jgi:broad specificity phosphatase PhoE
LYERVFTICAKAEGLARVRAHESNSSFACGVRWNFSRLLRVVGVLLAMHQQQHDQPQQQSAIQQQEPASITSLSRHLSSVNNSNYQCRIFLMRHGETDWNDQGKMQGGGASAVDIALNEKGKQQAASLARELYSSLLANSPNNTSLDVIASSHLLRARQTADAILLLGTREASIGGSHVKRTRMSTKRLTLTGFREMDYGIHEGLYIHGPASTSHSRQIFEQYVNPMQAGDLDLAWPGAGGESIRQVEQRAVEALHQVLQEQNQSSSSGGVLSSSDDAENNKVPLKSAVIWLLLLLLLFEKQKTETLPLSRMPF